jgi:acetyl esterase/lipase
MVGFRGWRIDPSLESFTGRFLRVPQHRRQTTPAGGGAPAASTCVQAMTTTAAQRPPRARLLAGALAAALAALAFVNPARSAPHAKLPAPAYAAPSELLSAAAQAFADRTPAAPYMELTAPAGVHRGDTPKGLVIVLHGGGWKETGPKTVRLIRPAAERFAKLGWAVANIDYRPGADGLTDVLGFYDHLRAKAPHAKIVLYGQSAGAHLSLMTALRRRSVNAVIAEGAPTDLRRLASQTAPGPHGRWSTGPRSTYRLATTAFGSKLAPVSPITLTARLRAPVLLGHTTNDQLVPIEQMTAFRDKRPDLVTAMRLQGSNAADATPFTHGLITPAAHARWDTAQTRMLTRIARRPANAARVKAARRRAMRRPAP